MFWSQVRCCSMSLHSKCPQRPPSFCSLSRTSLTKQIKIIDLKNLKWHLQTVFYGLKSPKKLSVKLNGRFPVTQDKPTQSVVLHECPLPGPDQHRKSVLIALRCLTDFLCTRRFQAVPLFFPNAEICFVALQEAQRAPLLLSAHST